MKCAKIIIGPLVLLAVTVIGMRAEAVNREYCLSNFTDTPERCLCGAKNDWQNQENKFSTHNIFQSFCAQLVSLLSLLLSDNEPECVIVFIL